MLLRTVGQLDRDYASNMAKAEFQSKSLWLIIDVLDTALCFISAKRGAMYTSLQRFSLPLS